MQTQFRNLVFKGGGVKGIAYIGAIEAIEEMDILPGVLRTCGASSGAIMATHLALGGKAAQLGEAMTSRFLAGLLDGSGWPMRDLQRLIQDYGWFPGKRLAHWMKRHTEQLSGVPGLTFADLDRLHARNPARFKQLTVIATNVTRQCPQVFDSFRTPHTPVWEALRASMSIPFLFAAPKANDGDIYSDGGLIWNYPLNYYDDMKWLSRPGDTRLYDMISHASDHTKRRIYNKETLGFMVETRRPDAAHEDERPGGGISGFSHYLKAMIGLMTDNATSAYLNLPDWQRTIFIEAHGVRATDFSIPDATVKLLLDTGRQAARDYFSWFSDPQREPLNRVPLAS